MEKDSQARVAVDVMLMKNKVVVTGQVSTKEKVAIKEIVRKCLQEIGYDNALTGIDYRSCQIETNLFEQSEALKRNAQIGAAGDQGIMFGFACSETEEYMPFGIFYAHRLAERLAQVRKQNILDYLEPDGKVQITVRYEDYMPVAIDSIVLSTQHQEYVELARMKKELIANVIQPVIPEKYKKKDMEILINPAGRFIVGGPSADIGITGRKIVMDSYGGYARHGGGAFSGKDASKVDRSAAYMLRYIAKNIVAKGIAKKCELQIAYSIGVEKPIALGVNTFGTSKISDEKIIDDIFRNYDLTPRRNDTTPKLR